MGKIKNATAVGKYRSKLERYCAEQLKKAELKAEYEPYRFKLIPSFRYNGVSIERIGKSFKQQREGQAAITYTPDFVGDGWIIECKGHFTTTARLKWKLFKYHLNHSDLKYDLYMPTNQTEVKQVINLIRKEKNM